MERRVRVSWIRVGVLAALAGGWSLWSAGVLEAAATSKDVRVTGRVLDAKTVRPIAGATVMVREWRALCDAEGRFLLSLPPGQWTVEASASSYQQGSAVVDACVACAPEVDVFLFPKGFVQEQVEVTATIDGGSDAVATTPVRPREVMNAAGAFENIFRVLHTLPGVTTTNEFSSRLSVRGGGPDQNMTVLDGIEIHNPYRLYGLVSAFNPETVDTFELSTGAFSAKYGDRLSSILTIDSRSGKTSTLATGSVGLSLTDGNGIFEGRLPGRLGSWLVTGRRTWYDLVAERFTDDELPAFEDVQGKVALDLGRGRSLTFFGLRSRERSDQEIEEDFDTGKINTKTNNDVAAATLFLPLGTRLASRTIGAFYDNADTSDLSARFRDEERRSNAPEDTAGFAFSDVIGSIRQNVRDHSLRQELTWSASTRHIVEAGFERHQITSGERLEITLPNRPDEGLRTITHSHDAERKASRMGAWLADRARLTDWLEVEAGLRYDRSRINDRHELAPRLSMTLRPSSRTRLRAAFGIHTQSPGYEKLSQADYSLDLTEDSGRALKNERAWHLIAGLERDLAPGLTARVEGFHKRFDDLLIGRLETPEEVQQRLAPYDFPSELAGSVPRAQMITAVPTNEGKGRAYGVDVFLAKRATSSHTRFSGWLAYTYTKATRDAYGRTHAFDYEQPHVLSIVTHYRASQRLELSLTGRFTSGFPQTPPLGLYVTGVHDTADVDGDGRTREVIPERDGGGRLVYAIDYGSVGNINAARQPGYARFDFRATFVPRWGKGRWRLYLDVINVLRRDNGLVHRELAFAPDSTMPRIVEVKDGGFPLLPSFGIHVRF